MTSALNQLVDLVSPPAGRRPEIDWVTAETALGLRLPSDYKSVIETYGDGQFDEFLTLYQPVTPFLTINLGYQAKRQSEILAQLRFVEYVPFAEGELLPVAGTDNGDTLYWVLEDRDDPESWTITGNEARDTIWPRFPGGIADFLLAVLSRRTRFPIFPQDFPSRSPRFRSVGEPDPVRLARLRDQGLYRDL